MDRALYKKNMNTRKIEQLLHLWALKWLWLWLSAPTIVVVVAVTPAVVVVVGVAPAVVVAVAFGEAVEFVDLSIDDSPDSKPSIHCARIRF